MDKGTISLPITISIKAYGRRASFMVREITFMPMKIVIQVIGKKVKKMATEYITIKIIVNSMVNG